MDNFFMAPVSFILSLTCLMEMLFPDQIQPFRIIVLFAILALQPICITAGFPCSGSLMDEHVVGLVFTDNEISWSMMMDDGPIGEIVPQCLFCYHVISTHISIDGSGVLRHRYKKISPSFRLPPLPTGVICPQLVNDPSVMALDKSHWFAFGPSILFTIVFRWIGFTSAAALTQAVRDCILGISHDVLSCLEKVKVRAVDVLAHFFGSFFYTTTEAGLQWL